MCSMNILIGYLFVTTFLLCSVHCVDYVIIPETCTESLFAYPDDCTKYYVCLHGRPFKMPCGPGTHWNNKLKVCDWPHNAGCVEVPTIHPGGKLPEPVPDPLKPDPIETETTEPIPTEPEATESTSTEPEATEPTSTEPEATEPEPTEPEATEPTPTEPEATEPEPTEPEATEAEPNEPTPTEPEPTEPEATEAEPNDEPEQSTDRDVGKEDNLKVICYFTNAASREPVRYNPLDLKWRLCSHIVYTFAMPDPVTFLLRPSDPWADIENKFYEDVTNLRHDGVHVSIAVNGLVDNDDDIPNPILTDANTRQQFVASAVEFIEKHNFDGLELDLEYASCVDSDCDSQIMQEKSGVLSLIQELSAAFKPHGWLLSATASSRQSIINQAYDIPQWAAYLDWISLVTYDYHSSLDSQTGHNSPIYSSDHLNIDSTVKYFIEKGAPSQKLIVGISGYGQSYTLAGENHGLNAPTTGSGSPGVYSKVRGLLAYYEICFKTKHYGWTAVHGQSGTYAYSSNEWVSYDDVDNIRAKGKYIREMNLAGGMLWTLDFDDFTAICGCGYYPLLTTLNQELRGIGGEPLQNCT